MDEVFRVRLHPKFTLSYASLSQLNQDPILCTPITTNSPFTLAEPTAIEVQPGHTKVLTNLKTIKMKAVREFQAGDHDSAFQLFTKVRRAAPELR
jgi:hypothetical protein